MTADRMTHLGRLLGASALGMSLAIITAPAAMASDAADAATSQPTEGLTEIVVTAQKRRENLQTTPVAISVLDSKALANRHVTSLADLADGAIPSLHVAPFGSRPGALILNIRGLGVMSDSNQPARDTGVGVYIDGVYLGRTQGLGAALFDIDSIEVLKGPQGTLFGRNTEGGAVNITTKKPTGEFHLNATGGMGNLGSYKTEVHLDLPAFHNIAVKIDGVIAHRDGTVKNPLAGQADFNAYDKRGIHAEALWKPAPNFSADYSYDASYDATTTLYSQVVVAGTAARAVAQPIEPKRASVANIGVVEQPSVGKTHGHRLTLEWLAAPKLTIKSISAYRSQSQTQYDGGSANISTYAPNGLFSRYSLAHQTQNQVSEELQAIGEIGRVKYVAGATFYQEKVGDTAQAYSSMVWNATGTAATVNPVNSDTVSIDRASHVTSTSLGLYGQGTYTPPVLDDKLHLTAGARWSRDMKHGQLYIINGATPTVNGVTAPQQLNAAWSRVDPMVNLAYDVTSDVHVYGKWSTGYRSGGANSRSLTYAPFKPETVSMFEIGAKTEFFDRRARLNVAAYTGTYKNIQIDFGAQYVQTINGVVQTTNRTTTETDNAPGTGQLRGVDADLSFILARGLTASANYAYTYVHIPASVNPFPTNGVYTTTPTTIYPVYTPTTVASGSLDYEKRLQDVTVHAHLDANYDSGFYMSSTWAYAGSPIKGDAAVVFNGRLSFADIAMGNSGAKLGLAVWARNLFNEQHLWYKSYSSTLGTYGFFNDPRTWGLEANLRF